MCATISNCKLSRRQVFSPEIQKSIAFAHFNFAFFFYYLLMNRMSSYRLLAAGCWLLLLLLVLIVTVRTRCAHFNFIFLFFVFFFAVWKSKNDRESIKKNGISVWLSNGEWMRVSTSKMMINEYVKIVNKTERFQMI